MNEGLNINHDSGTLVYYDKRDVFYLFGGYINNRKTNFLFEINIKTNYMKHIKSKILNIPKRSNHNSLIIKDSLFIFGGVGKSSNILNDFYEYDLNYHQLKEIQVAPRP